MKKSLLFAAALPAALAPSCTRPSLFTRFLRNFA